MYGYCEFCNNVLDAFKLQSDKPLTCIDLGLLKNIMALDCRFCQSLRERIQAESFTTLKEHPHYDTTSFSLEIAKYSGTTSLKFSITHSTGSFTLDVRTVIELVRGVLTPW
jgi:hypothetical protein